MNLTPEDIIELEKSPIYQYYKETDWATLTTAIIEAHLDAIPKTSIENLPLIKFLSILLSTKQQTTLFDNQDTIKAYITDLIGGQYTNDIVLNYRSTNATVADNLADYAMHEVEHTLAGGALANAQLYAPGAGKKYAVYWFLLGSTLATAAQAYTMIYHQESASGFFDTLALNEHLGTRKWFVYALGDTADKDFMVDFAGGDGVEHLFTRTVAGRF